MQTVSVLVAESGTEWLGWARKLRAAASNLLVLAQNKTENHAEFSARVSERISRLRQDGVPVREAAYVSGDNADPESRSRRSRVLRRLSSVLARTGPESRLYLDPSQPRQPESRTLMQALAWALSDLTAGSGLSVLVGDPGGAPA